MLLPNPDLRITLLNTSTGYYIPVAPLEFALGYDIVLLTIAQPGARARLSLDSLYVTIGVRLTQALEYAMYCYSLVFRVVRLVIGLSGLMIEPAAVAWRRLYPWLSAFIMEDGAGRVGPEIAIARKAQEHEDG